MKSAIVIQHLAFETIGTYGPLLERLGYQLTVCLAGRDDIRQFHPLSADLAVVMGGPIGVYQADDYPLLHAEMKWLQDRLAADRPTLGICLGAQLMAASLGAKVVRGHGPELGWQPILLTDRATHHPIAELTRGSGAVLHWHNDTFDLPTGAKLLASTPAYPNQAFAIGQRGLAIQFHAEVEPTMLEQWYIGFTGDIGRLGKDKLAELRRDTKQQAPALKLRAEAFLSRWLSTASVEDRAA
jgi:GMP synthase (glutamine-hydrolysing)